MDSFSINNIVATAPIEYLVDWTELSDAVVEHMGVEASRRPAWVSCRLGPKSRYVAFYRRGSYLISGCKNTQELTDTASDIAFLLEKAAIAICTGPPRIHNIVTGAKLRLRNSLEHIAENLDAEYVSYEPEQFPGVHVKTPQATFLVFGSGAIVSTGTRSERDALGAMEQLEHLLAAIGSLA